MVNRYKHKDTVWVDLKHPTTEEVRAVMEEFSIDPLVANEMTSESPKSRVEAHRDFLYLILHFPVFKHTHTGDSKQELDFIIGKDFLITVRYDTIDALEKFAKVVEVKEILDRDFEEDCTGVIFFGILQEIYSSLFNELEYIGSSVSRIEEGIFAGKEREMVIELSIPSRDLLNFKKYTDFHRDVLENLETLGLKLFGDHFAYHVKRIIHEYKKMHNALRSNLELISELRETNNSLLSTKQNEIMKTLTIIAFITFPLTLIASIFGMNTSFIPIVGRSDDFWIVISIMLVATFFMFMFFKYKKWL